MELQRYGFLFLLCLSSLVISCAKQAEPKPTFQQTYDWNRNQGTDDDSPDDCANVDGSGRAEAEIPAGIVGGQEVHQNNWLAKGIVFLMQTFQDADGKERTSICTASLVDTNIVLTAAHCVDRSRDNVSQLSVYFTAHPECEKQHGRLQRKKRVVNAVKIHPNWDPEQVKMSDRGDLALIRISGRAPSSYRPLKLATNFVPLAESTPILVAGYGMVNPDYYGDFGGAITLRVTQAPGISKEQKDTLMMLTQSDHAASENEMHEFDNLAKNEMLYIDQSQGRGICGGDSGGPSVMKSVTGDDVVTGVASFVMNPEDPNVLCGYVAAHTSVFFHKDWILKTFQELKNGDSTLPTPFR